MDSDWFTRFIDQFWQNDFAPKSRYGVQNRLRSLLEPAIIIIIIITVIIIIIIIKIIIFLK